MIVNKMPGGNSAYSPLPQSNSDSDGSSEEELRLSQERIINRAGKTQNSKTDKTYNNGQKHNITNYKPLDSDGDVGVKLITFQPSTDEVSILKPNSNLEMLSTSRKICFVISLLLCILTTVVFIWVLPCNVETCPYASNGGRNNYTWEETFPDLEIHGPISLVPNYSGRNQSLIFLTRNSPFENRSEDILMSLHGINGSLGWKVKLSNQPTDIDCRLVDINQDGFSDCLVFGKNFLKAFNSLTGKELWDVHDSNKKLQLQVLDFPLVIPDFDTDGVKDLLVLGSYIIEASDSGVSFQNCLVIISAKTGAILDKPVLIKFCSAVYNLVYENISTISYTCYNSSKKESLKTVNLKNLYNIVKDVSVEKSWLPKWEKLSQHQKPSNNIYLNGLRLTLDNQGSCPEDCMVVVDVKDDHSSLKNKTVYTFTSRNTFGMMPVVTKSEQRLSFVIKLWTWHPRKQNDSDNHLGFVTQRNPSLKISRSNKLSNSLALDREMLLASGQEFNRSKRALTETNDTDTGSFNLRLINETVIQITFDSNRSQVQVKKILEDEVIQMCKKRSPCQPDVHLEEYSMLIADLNQDRKDELVTFNSGYVHVDGNTQRSHENWKFHSRIRVMDF